MIPKYDNMFYYLRNDKVERIINLLENQKNGLELAKIVKLTNLHYNTVKKYLKTVKDMKLIKILIKNQRIVFLLDNKYYNEIMKLIKIKKKEIL